MADLKQVCTFSSARNSSTAACLRLTGTSSEERESLTDLSKAEATHPTCKNFSVMMLEEGLRYRI